MINIHGNDKYNFEGCIQYDFSSNVWFRKMRDLFFEELNKRLRNVSDYPHPTAGDFAKQLATFYALDETQVLVTNGSTEAMYLLAQAFAGKRSAIITPAFAEYEAAAKRFSHQLSFYPNSEAWNTRLFSEDLVWFGNPNNPDGAVLSPEQIAEMATQNPNTVFVIDEAYAGLCPNFTSAIELLKTHRNLLILRSFTKAFAIPGIRLGYLLGDAKLLEKMAAFCIPWSVGSVAIDAGNIILENRTEFTPDFKELKALRTYFKAELDNVSGLEVQSARCNYFLLRMKTSSAAELKTYLATEHGILIRDASNFRGLSAQHFRVSVQEKCAIDALISAIKQYFS